MNRLIVACASALFLVACTAESTTPAETPPANAEAATSTVKLELGKNI